MAYRKRDESTDSFDDAFVSRADFSAPLNTTAEPGNMISRISEGGSDLGSSFVRALSRGFSRGFSTGFDDAPVASAVPLDDGGGGGMMDGGGGGGAGGVGTGFSGAGTGWAAVDDVGVLDSPAPLAEKLLASKRAAAKVSAAKAAARGRTETELLELEATETSKRRHLNAVLKTSVGTTLALLVMLGSIALVPVPEGSDKIWGGCSDVHPCHVYAPPAGLVLLAGGSEVQPLPTLSSGYSTFLGSINHGCYCSMVRSLEDPSDVTEAVNDFFFERCGWAGCWVGGLAGERSGVGAGR